MFYRIVHNLVDIPRAGESLQRTQHGVHHLLVHSELALSLILPEHHPHPRSLISAFVIRLLKNVISKLAMYK